MKDELKAAIKEAVREAIAESALALQYDGWIDIHQAAGYIHRSTSTIEKLVRKKAIPFHRKEKYGRLLFKKSELDEWLAAQGKGIVTGSLRDAVARIRGKE